MKSHKTGFTLIELLVVISIIGLLAAVVLVSLQSARKKGNDSRIQSEAAQMRVSLETNFLNNTFPNLTLATRLSPRPSGGNSSNIDTLIGDIIIQQNNGGLTGLYGADSSGAFVSNSTIVITKDSSNPAKGYAIYAKLPGGGVYCIDSAGNAKSNSATYPLAAPTTDALAIVCQ